MAHPADRSDEFETTFGQNRRRLFAIAFAILRDPGEAEDAVQETATLAWQAWGGRNDVSKTPAWLSTICVRRAIGRRRKLLKRVFLSDSARADLAAADKHLTDDGRHLDLHRAYGTLSPRQRAIIVLRYRHGYTVAEAAEIMGCSAGAAASHLARALAKLRAELSNERV